MPVGFAHGFQVLSEVADVAYKLTSLYDPETESEIAWDDPDVGIEWPVADPLLSERDKARPAAGRGRRAAAVHLAQHRSADASEPARAAVANVDRLATATKTTDETDPLAAFSARTRAWFERSFEGPTPAQAEGWPAIATGANTLICAPTGSGKTLAAFLWGIDSLARESAGERRGRTRACSSSTSRR